MNIQKSDIEFYNKKIEKHEFSWGIEQRLFHLFEEVGEFSEIYLQYTEYKKPPKTKEDIQTALSDIFEDVLALSILFKLDINKIIKDAIYKD